MEFVTAPGVASGLSDVQMALIALIGPFIIGAAVGLEREFAIFAALFGTLAVLFT